MLTIMTSGQPINPFMRVYPEEMIQVWKISMPSAL